MKSEKNILFVLAASAAVILLVTVLTLFSGEKKPAKTQGTLKGPTPTAAVTKAPEKKNNIFAMIKEVDVSDGTISIYELSEGGMRTLTYETAADIRDKYGSLTYAASLSYGDIVHAEYDSDNQLICLQKSADHWELRGVDDFTISDTRLTVNGVNYKITENTIFYCEGSEIAKGEVMEIDRINICGYDEKVLSVCVTKGHGSFQLIHGESFQGATVTFGEEEHTLLGEPTYYVREGSCRVVIRGEKDSTLVELTIGRNEQMVVDLYEYGGKPVEYSTVRFHISPFSAVLTIDGESVDYYEQDLSLAYGEHKITVSLGGYRSYQGMIKLGKAYQSYRIDLIESTGSGIGIDIVSSGDGNSGSGGGSGGDGSSGTGEGSGGDGNSGTGGDGNGGTGQASGDHEVFWISEALVMAYPDRFSCDSSQYTRISKPEGVSVRIEGFDLGLTTPIRFGKLIGTYTITLSKDGETKEYTVTVNDDGEPVDWRFPDF